jgi:hypothetical protein
MLVAIGSIASAQNNGAEATMQEVTHLLNYCATHPNAVIRFKASDMVLHIHSDASTSRQVKQGPASEDIPF